MAEKDIIQNMIFQLGQSQGERAAVELQAHFADVDERSAGDFLDFAATFAKSVYYYPVVGSPGHWGAFFDNLTGLQSLDAASTGDVAPHLALYRAFLELYRKPQEILNQFTGRHLDYYYRDVLRFTSKAATPDRTHVVLVLKKGAASVAVRPEHRFSAGKDALGIERLYAPTGETVINTARVESLMSVFRDATNLETIRHAPIANSADGLGEALPAETPAWSGFGHAQLPQADIGFAIASPVLRMREGIRTATVNLTLGGDTSRLTTATLSGAFHVYLTGEKNWLGPFSINPTVTGSVFKFTVQLDESWGPVVDYRGAVHGHAYTATTPVLQVLLKADGTTVGYSNFTGVTVQDAAVKVDVSNVSALSLESDHGTLDPKKAFLPFGSQPTPGARFQVGCAEALSKRLTGLDLHILWKDIPENFSEWYLNYPTGHYPTKVNNTFFKAKVTFKDAAGWSVAASNKNLFHQTNATSEQRLEFNQSGVSTADTSSSRKVYGLWSAGSQWSKARAEQLVRARPVLEPTMTSAPTVREGFIQIDLQSSFLHAEYRKTTIENVLKYGKQAGSNPGPTILNEPYSPTIQRFRLSYGAETSVVKISTTPVDAGAAGADEEALGHFTNSDLQFFHVACFGQMREHGYQRQQFDFVQQKSVPLLPAYPQRGELLIGVAGLRAGDSFSLLFQVAEGSADPTLSRAAVAWAVLCDNYWRPLQSREITFDSTNNLLRSGIVKGVVPPQATTANTVMPTGFIWIKAAIDQDVLAVCKLIEVAANAVELRFVDQGNDPKHLESALPAKAITKLKNGLAAVKSLKQPYASFDGAPSEADGAFNTRVSERLRHKNRCITPWDYERIVLEAFPRVHKVKCIPHAREGSWLAPGHVLLVVVPDLRNRNDIDPLQPKVDADTLVRIAAHTKALAGMGVKVGIKNPLYQRVRVDFKVQFYPGFDFNHSRIALEQALIQVLSPWAYEGGRELSFGGTIYRSVLLDFVEELEYVDYVTDFKMFTYSGDGTRSDDLNEVQAETPDAIVVSDYSHTIVGAT